MPAVLTPPSSPIDIRPSPLEVPRQTTFTTELDTPPSSPSDHGSHPETAHYDSNSEAEFATGAEPTPDSEQDANQLLRNHELHCLPCVQ